MPVQKKSGNLLNAPRTSPLPDSLSGITVYSYKGHIHFVMTYKQPKIYLSDDKKLL